MLTAAGCSDDTFGTREADPGSTISFSVATEGYRRIGSRSAAEAPAQLVLTDSTGCKLYLIPQVTPMKPESRSASVNTDDMAGFGVYATITGGDPETFYMQNVEVTRANGWAPAKAYLWPGNGSLTFTAYSPYRTGSDAPVTDASGALTLHYVTPADVADQTDLLRADPVEASASPCALTFSHSLASIGFAAGDEMAPCTVTAIELSGIASSGTLALATGEWSDTSGSATYTVAPGTSLAAAAGSKYATPDTPITSDSQRFMLIPQEGGDGAELALTIVGADGNPTTFRASLAGQKWGAGERITYRISASPASPELILQLVDADGNNLEEISTPYTGGTRSYTVVSRYIDPVTGDTLPVKWTAELLDAAGNSVTTLPDWVESLTAAGTDNTHAAVTTALPEPVFLDMSTHTATMRREADINASSGHTPYNLASSTGAATVENTANCYIINAPGVYSLPLVYGNAVKNGATNSAAYISTLAHTRSNNTKVLYTFVNHLGNEITDPYIYNNSGCTPADAMLLWEDHLNIVRDVKLAADGRTITFNVPASSLRQGNAMIAVRDTDGNIMWSWHLWLTDHRMADSWQTIVGETETDYLSSSSIGRLYAGDRTEFKEQEATVRFTQTDVPDGMTPLTLDLKLIQGGKTIYTDDCYTYFQWGRKDAIVSSHDTYYDASHNELSSESLPTIQLGDTHKDMIVSSILHPDKYVTGSEKELGKFKTFYLNLWSIDHISASAESMEPQNVKTIYDPSPVGGKVAVGNSFHTLASLTGTYDSTTRSVTVIAPGSGDILEFPLLGHRGVGSMEYSIGSNGQVWTTVAGRSTSIVYLMIDSNGRIQRPVNDALMGMSVRPSKDE